MLTSMFSLNTSVTSKICAYRDSNLDCLSRVRRSAGLSVPGRDTDCMSCSVLICALRSLYSALKSIPLHKYINWFLIFYSCICCLTITYIFKRVLNKIIHNLRYQYIILYIFCIFQKTYAYLHKNFIVLRFAYKI